MTVLELRAPSATGVGLQTYAAAVRIADLVLMTLATAVAWRSWSTDPAVDPTRGWGIDYLLWAVPLVIVWYCILEVADAYDIVNVAGAVHELRAVVAGTVFLAAALAIAGYLFQIDMSRAFYLLTFGLGLVFLVISHFVVRQLLRRAHCRGLYMRPVVAVGRRRTVEDLVNELERSKYAGLQVVAACVPEEEAWEPIGPVPWVFPTSSLHEVVVDSGASHVFLLSGAGESPRHIRRIAWSLEGTDTQLAVVPNLTDIAGGRIRPRPVAGLSLIELEQPQLHCRELDLAPPARGFQDEIVNQIVAKIAGSYGAIELNEARAVARKSQAQIQAYDLVLRAREIMQWDWTSDNFRAAREAMNRAIAVTRMRPVVDRVFGFEQAPAALRYFETGQHFGKVVIRCN